MNGTIDLQLFQDHCSYSTIVLFYFILVAKFVWKEAEDLIYEEVLEYPRDFDVSVLLGGQHELSGSEDLVIGKLGEHIVNHYLQDCEAKSLYNIVKVEWIQEDMEHGTPYDFVVTIRGTYMHIKAHRINTGGVTKMTDLLIKQY